MDVGEFDRDVKNQPDRETGRDSQFGEDQAVGLFAVSTTIVMLYGGCTLLVEVPSGVATLVVPAILMANYFLCKLTFTSLFAS